MRNDGRRPDGVTMLPWSRGRSLAWDFTCVHRLAASHLSKGRQEGSSVATAKEAIKRQLYNDIPSRYILEPVAIETLGGIGDSSWAFLRTLGQRIQEQAGENAPLLGYDNASASPSKEEMPPVFWNRSLTHQTEATTCRWTLTSLPLLFVFYYILLYFSSFC